MKTQQIHLKTILVALFSATCVFTACSIDSLETSNNELTQEELEITSQIIGESLSNQNDGIISSLNDAFVIPSVDGMNSSAKVAGVAENSEYNDTTNTDSDYTYSYDPETGIHSVSFLRSVNQPSLSKEASVELSYIFYDIDGGFIEFPRAEKDRIETVDYTAEKSGSIETPRKNSSYTRNDQFLADGLSSGSNTIQIDGIHEGTGQFEINRANGDLITRSYTLSIDFLNVQIDKERTQQGQNLQSGVTGAVAYEITINRSVNGEESTKTVNGTIEFNGDGTALLRFRDFLDIFRIKLDDGRVYEDDEFEGYVQSVNLDESSFTLFSGQKIYITDNTEFDDGDFRTLDEVADALDRGANIEAEGDVNRRDDGTYVATEVEFELEDDDFEFEGYVESVDLETSTFTLTDGMTLYVTDRTKFDDEDYESLAEVSEALENSIRIEAEGEFIPEDDGTLLAIEVEFESDDDDNDGEED